MAADAYRFGDFTLYPGDRRLAQGDRTLDLGHRYFDALSLLVREQGRLVSKDRFLEEVWNGVPVTDEALTQCIRTLRRELGDEATKPRFIETVPKHGYRFIAPVSLVAPEAATAPPALSIGNPWRHLAALAGAGTVGGGIAGIGGGLFYGFIANADPLRTDMGATSILFVLLAINLLVGLVAGAGVGGGIAIADLLKPNRAWSIVLGGGVGGMLTGAVAKLIGMDAFRLLFGQALNDMTGAPEGLLLGGAIGLAVWLTRRPRHRLVSSLICGALTSGLAAMAIVLFGGRLLGGSLDLLLNRLPSAGLSLDPIATALGEATFGPVSQIVTSGIEGLLFGACMVGALRLASEALAADRSSARPVHAAFEAPSAS